MKRLIVFVSILSLPLLLMASVNKTEFIKKYFKAQQVEKNNLSGSFEIKMFMMGLPMKMWGNFWMKGPLYKTDMLTQLPNAKSPVNSIIIFDGKTIWRIGKTMIMKIDTNKLPEPLKKEQIQNSVFLGINEFSDNMAEYYKKASITEEKKDGEKYYVVTIQGKLIKGSQDSNINNLRSVVLLIEEKDMLVREIDLNAKNNTPSVSIIFNNLSTKPIPESIFAYEPPKNIKVFDMTELIGTMYKTMNKNQP